MTKWQQNLGIGVCLSLVLVLSKTAMDFREVPLTAQAVVGPATRFLIVDRSGQRLTSTYENEWNLFAHVGLQEIPEFLVKAFVASEDRKFFEHAGVDWPGRFAAFYSALENRHFQRGASTISEQVVRMIHPRPRTFWSRWLETCEAYQLERRWDKASILEFYLNQVPYSNQRRGIYQAAHFYFGRDPNTLNTAEMLALAVLVRAPRALDPGLHAESLLKRVRWLAREVGVDPASEPSLMKVSADGFELSQKSEIMVDAPHFAELVRRSYPGWKLKHAVPSNDVVHTTLDGALQNFAEGLLVQTTKKLKDKNVNHGALLIADHQTGEILAWAVSGGTQFNTVLVPRQPGSTLKPFLYSLALVKGWTAATIIVDEPYVTAVGRGAHEIRNYSRTHYGAVTVREALGNSLNVPAVKTIQFVTTETFLNFLKQVPFSDLDRSASFYGDGLALGSAEVSLFELVQGYTMFPNQGRVRPLRWFQLEPTHLGPQLIPSEVASLVTNILSDPKARALEFGNDSILNFPTRTAVKTGTATDYRDAWAVGFNGRYLVGAWMGDLDRHPTDGNTGSRGPALLLRSVFSHLNQITPESPADANHLAVNPNLIPQEICKEHQQMVLKGSSKCFSRYEYFVPGTELKPTKIGMQSGGTPGVDLRPRITFPTPNVEIAWDPRLRPEAQALQLQIENLSPGEKVRWQMNDVWIAENRKDRLLWPLQRGHHRVSGQIVKGDGTTVQLREVPFLVK